MMMPAMRQQAGWAEAERQLAAEAERRDTCTAVRAAERRDILKSECVFGLSERLETVKGVLKAEGL